MPSETNLERRIVELPNAHGTRYCVLGPDGAVDFHFTKLDGYDVCAGLECHYKRRPTYFKPDAEPFSEKCWLTGVRCWGDGTSLYATEQLYPLFEALGVEGFWIVLETEYRKRFDPREVSFVEGTESTAVAR